MDGLVTVFQFQSLTEVLDAGALPSTHSHPSSMTAECGTSGVAAQRSTACKAAGQKQRHRTAWGQTPQPPARLCTPTPRTPGETPLDTPLDSRPQIDRPGMAVRQAETGRKRPVQESSPGSLESAPQEGQESCAGMFGQGKR